MIFYREKDNPVLPKYLKKGVLFHALHTFTLQRKKTPKEGEYGGRKNSLGLPGSPIQISSYFLGSGPCRIISGFLLWQVGEDLDYDP
jgi:hypothetical protein